MRLPPADEAVVGCNPHQHAITLDRGPDPETHLELFRDRERQRIGGDIGNLHWTNSLGNTRRWTVPRRLANLPGQV